MKYLTILCLTIAYGCAHQRSPSSTNAPVIAQDSIGGGKIKATAMKSADEQQTCFNIDLAMIGNDQSVIEPSNWTLAWIDQKDHYHLLNMSQRDPASSPQDHRVAGQYGEYHEWTNSFKTCAPGVKTPEVKSLVLTPKSLPFKETDGLHLDWTK